MEGRTDLLAYRDTMIASNQASREAHARVRQRKASPEDLRLLSVGPMSEGDYIHARLLMTPRKAGGRTDDRHQTTGAQQLAAIVSKRGGPGAEYWQRKLMGVG